MSKINTKRVKETTINKILVTGHPMSGYESAAALLATGGMVSAKVSRSQGMAPAEISSALLKSHPEALYDPMLPGSEIRQLSVSPVWNGLALDLMLGNLEQPFWCWADAQAVSLLDYWKSLDSHLAFVLVYDTPQEFIARAIGETEAITSDVLETILREWGAYNRALLRFYHRNASHSMLVHAGQTHDDGSRYLRYVSSQTGLPLSTDVTQEELACVREASTRGSAAENMLNLYLAEELLQQYPGVMQLYAELQSVADLPSQKLESSTVTVPQVISAVMQIKSDQQQVLHASRAEAVAFREEYRNLEDRLHRLNAEREVQAAENGRLFSRLHAVQEEFEQLQIKSRQEIGGLKESLAALTKERNRHANENEQLLSQLHAVQEELEQQFLGRREEVATLNEKLTRMSNEHEEKGKSTLELQKRFETLNVQLESTKKERDTLVREKAQIGEQAEAVEQKMADMSREYANENELLLSQLHAVQEELEQQYLSGREEIDTLNEKLTRVSKEHEEKGRSTQELQKRFEALNVQFESMKKERDMIARQKAQMVEHSQMKDLEKENELLLGQLYHVQEELEGYFLENKELKQKVPVAKPRPIGAAERIKRQLSYRLGAVMVQQARSPLAVVSMPVALVREIRRFRREYAERAGEKLPPIEHYADAHEAERVKNHLSYRLGKAMVENGRSPIGWVKLPWALRKANIEYRQSRKSD